MVKEYLLTLRPDKPWKGNLGYYLYGALMEKVPRSVGEQYHKDGFTPIRQYSYPIKEGFLWRITLFGQAISVLEPFLTEGSLWHLRRENIKFTCVSLETSPVLEPEDFFQRTENKNILQFHTAAAFKQRNQYQNLPNTQLIFQSLSRKWNEAFPTARIEDEDGEGIKTLAEGVYFKDYTLKQEKYPLKNQEISGFVGELELGFRLTGFHLTLSKVLLEFGHYSGVGIKTSLGMGGCRLKKEKKS